MRIRKRLQLYLGLCKWYGQRKEDKIIAEYFGSFKGTLLSIGENDGITYSNVLYFIKRGWRADVLDPSPEAFARLSKRHFHNPRVSCRRLAIGLTTGQSIFWESGSLVGLGDTGLVSTLSWNIKEQWKNTSFRKTTVQVVTFADYFTNDARYNHYDLISIDAEGADLDIVVQMDLKKLGCKCLVIEHGGDVSPLVNLIQPQGYRLLVTTEENLIFVKI